MSTSVVQPAPPMRRLAAPRLVHAASLHVGYRGVPLLPPLSFVLETGQTWFLVGRNGSGKSTLLRTLLGLMPPILGQLELAEGLRVGYVPQRTSLDLSVPARVKDMLALGADTRWSFLQPGFPKETRRRMAEIVDTLQLQSLLLAQFAELSEGQKQRVLLARALLGDPQLLVLDEPTSAMDRSAQLDAQRHLSLLRVQRDICMLVVTHDLVWAEQDATHMIVLHREHKVARSGLKRDVIDALHSSMTYVDASRQTAVEGDSIHG